MPVQRTQVTHELEKKAFGLPTPGTQAWGGWDFSTSVCSREMPVTFWESLLLCKKLQENSQKRPSVWKRQTWLMWHLWGCILSPVEAAASVRKCCRPRQATDGKGWENSQPKQGHGNLQLGSLRKSTAIRLLQVWDCSSPFKPRKGCVLQIRTTIAPDITRKGFASKLCVSATGTDVTAAAHLQAEVGGRFLP